MYLIRHGDILENSDPNLFPTNSQGVVAFISLSEVSHIFQMGEDMKLLRCVAA